MAAFKDKNGREWIVAIPFGLVRKRKQVPGRLAADAEMTQASFTALLGSAERAAEMLDNLRKFAAATPFGFKGISESAKTLMQYGVSAEGVLPALQLLAAKPRGGVEVRAKLIHQLAGK